MNWDPNFLQVKSYFNAGEDGRTEQFTVSLALKSWLDGMSQDGRQRFLSSMKKGREFTSASLVDVSCYKSNAGVLTPSLMLLPTDFRLQS